MQQFVVLSLGLLAPVPRIFKGGYLCFALLSLGRPEQQVVIAFRVERRVEVDKIDRFVRDAVAQNVEIVAVVESIRHCECYGLRFGFRPGFAFAAFWFDTSLRGTVSSRCVSSLNA